MRKRSSPVLRTAAPAAIAPHRIPVLRTMYIVAATLLFFFLNLYFIYVYVQNYSKDELLRSFEKAHLSQPKEDSQHVSLLLWHPQFNIAVLMLSAERAIVAVLHFSSYFIRFRRGHLHLVSIFIPAISVTHLLSALLPELRRSLVREK